MAVLGEWSQESVKVGETLKGKLALKLLTKSNPISSAAFKYEFSSQGKTLKQGEGQVVNNSFEVEFKVPQAFEKVLVFSASVFVDESEVVYKKDFAEPTFDDVEVDFTLGNGKLVRGARNPVFFRAWENKQRKLEVPLSKIAVLK